MKRIVVVLVAAAIVAPALAQGGFWGSARNLSGDHMLWKFDAAGDIIAGAEVSQVGSQGSSWGARDGAADRDGHMYWGWESGVSRYDLNDGSGGTQIISGPAPGGVSTWRALAFDPTLDGGAGGLWTANFGSAIAATKLDGSLIKTLPWDGLWSLYGLAYDDATGDLWGHDWYGAVIKIDTDTGVATPAWGCGFPNLSAQGGLSAYHDGSGLVAALSQGTPDEAGVYDSATGSLVMGPWNWEGMTGSNGHLGVVVIPEPTSLLLLSLAGLLIRRR